MKKPKKIPASIMCAFTHQQAIMRFVDEAIDAKKLPLENQGTWVRDKTPDYYIGMAYATNDMLERLMFDNGCYRGFSYQRKNQTTLADGGKFIKFYQQCGPDHKEYADWRRNYL